MRLLITGGSGFIGTNLVAHYLARGVPLVNVDTCRPLDDAQENYWTEGSVSDEEALHRVFESFRPTHVVHLAARTDCVEDVAVEEGYSVNTTGTENVLRAISTQASVQRVIITSSQFVCGPDHLPAHPMDYGPHTIYGQSKVITEELTHRAALPCTWTLVRPVNIWGPWHLRYRREAWNAIRRGLYLHPAGRPVRRCYGYVGNVVWQMDRILEAPEQLVHRQVLYLGDRTVDIYDWVNEFSIALRGRPARRVPRLALRSLAAVGDVISLVRGRPFLLTSSRYVSMTQDYPAPTDITLRLLGEPPYSLREGVQETVAWLEAYGWPD
jgi:GlcNAc-P-P-Und epimerase